MPYVALAPANQEARSAAADAQWSFILHYRPELAPAVALQRNLLGLVGDAIEPTRARLPRLSLPARYLSAKLDRGIPALAGEPIPVPGPLLKPLLEALCDALAEGGAGDAARHIKAHLVETRIEAASLLSASLRRDQAAIRTAGEHRGLAPDLLWLVAELAVSPFVFALNLSLFGSVSPDSALGLALQAWSRGYCPLCGSWPALGEVVAAQRVLRCSFCALAWTGRAGCVYCGKDGETFATVLPADGRTDRRLETCAPCRAYLKTLDVPSLSPFPLLAIADLGTMDLDMVAMERGFGRPALATFAQR
jgi:FdhE protein